MLDTGNRIICCIYDCEETDLEKMWACLAIAVSIKEKESPPGDRLLYFCKSCKKNYFGELMHTLATKDDDEKDTNTPDTD